MNLGESPRSPRPIGSPAPTWPEAAAEHLAPVLGSTHAEYRTVPIIGRAHALRTLLVQRTDLASSTLATLNDDLAETSRTCPHAGCAHCAGTSK